MGRDEHILNPIAVFGFPRSGNTFVRSVLELAYPQFTFKYPRHSVKQLEDELNTTNIVIPFRNPLDCIGSWNLYRDENKHQLTDRDWRFEETVKDDIAYYIRFYTNVLKHLENLTLLEFDSFTNDLGYIYQRIEKFNLGKPQPTDIETVKDFMMKSDRHTNLPRDTKPLIRERQKYIQQEMLYADAIQLHERLIAEAEKQL